MLPWLTAVVLVAALVLAVVSLAYAARSRLVDDRLLLVLGVLEVAVVAQTVVGLVQGLGRSDGYEKPVFLAYLLTVPVVGPVTVFLSLKEKTRSSMLVVAGGAVVVGVLVARLTQVWAFRG